MFVCGNHVHGDALPSGSLCALESEREKRRGPQGRLLGDLVYFSWSRFRVLLGVASPLATTRSTLAKHVHRQNAIVDFPSPPNPTLPYSATPHS